MALKMPPYQLYGLRSPNQQLIEPGQFGKDLACLGDRRIGNRNRIGANSRIASDSLGHGKGSLEPA